MTDPKTEEIGKRLEEARNASKRKHTLSDIQDNIAAGVAVIETVDGLTGNHIPFATPATEIAEISIQGIGLFAKFRRMFGKKKVL